jgi:hypothetical protein
MRHPLVLYCFGHPQTPIIFSHFIQSCFISAGQSASSQDRNENQLIRSLTSWRYESASCRYNRHFGLLRVMSISNPFRYGGPISFLLSWSYRYILLRVISVLSSKKVRSIIQLTLDPHFSFYIRSRGYLMSRNSASATWKLVTAQRHP